MKNLILKRCCLWVVSLVFLALMFAGCSGLTSLLGLPVSPNAVQVYTDANGVRVEIVDTEAITPVRTQAIPVGDEFEVRMIMGCSQFVNMVTEAGTDSVFWLAQPVFVTYDSAPISDMCNKDCTWTWQADMNGDVGQVNMQCVVN